MRKILIINESLLKEIGDKKPESYEVHDSIVDVDEIGDDIRIRSNHHFQYENNNYEAELFYYLEKEDYMLHATIDISFIFIDEYGDESYKIITNKNHPFKILWTIIELMEKDINQYIKKYKLPIALTRITFEPTKEFNKRKNNRSEDQREKMYLYFLKKYATYHNTNIDVEKHDYGTVEVQFSPAIKFTQ
jgi:hypothetical protein